jgi:hypothetical protein
MAGVAIGRCAVRTFMKCNGYVLPVSERVVGYPHAQKWHLYMLDQNETRLLVIELQTFFSVGIFK